MRAVGSENNSLLSSPPAENPGKLRWGALPCDAELRMLSSSGGESSFSATAQPLITGGDMGHVRVAVSTALISSSFFSFSHTVNSDKSSENDHSQNCRKVAVTFAKCRPRHL